MLGRIDGMDKERENGSGRKEKEENKEENGENVSRWKVKNGGKVGGCSK